MYVPRFLGLPEKPRDKRSGIFPETFPLVKTFEKSIRNSRGNVTPADSLDVMSNVACAVKCLSLVQSGVLTIP